MSVDTERAGRAAPGLIYALSAVVLLAGCAASAQEQPPADPGVRLTRAEYNRLVAVADQVPALQALIAQLQERLAQVEQRVGLAAVPADRLHPVAEELTLSPPTTTFVDSATARPHSRSMSRHLQGFNGYVVSYWATWCVPCISDEELVLLHELQRQLRRHNVELVSIVVDELGKVRSHQKAPRWLYPLWHKQDAHMEMLPRSFITQVGLGLPLFLVVGRDGRIRYYYNSKLDPAAIRDMVSAVASACRI